MKAPPRKVVGCLIGKVREDEHGNGRVPRDRTILIAGMGTSPAVLTEMVWALAHQHDIIAAKGKAWSGVFS